MNDTTRRGSGRVQATPKLEFITEESVYGTVLVCGMIVVSRGYGASSWDTLELVLGTVVVFWIAHLYAGTVADYHTAEGEEASLRAAFRRALRRSIGFLTAAIVPSIALLLGALEAIPDDVAVWVALWLGVAMLAVIGYHVAAAHGNSWPVRILSSLATAAMGIAMILLKVLIH
ncbi:MAG: hypothetical protein ABWY57_17610 [Mycetocola sp.]